MSFSYVKNAYLIHSCISSDIICLGLKKMSPIDRLESELNPRSRV